MNAPQSDQILSILTDMSGDLKVVAAAVQSHTERLDEHDKALEVLKLDGATRHGEKQVREKWATRIFAVLPPVVGAAAGFGLGRLIH